MPDWLRKSPRPVKTRLGFPEWPFVLPGSPLATC